MTRFLSILFLFVILAGGTIHAADNNQAILCYQTGLYKNAKQLLNSNLKNDQINQSEIYYYLGKIALAEQKLDSSLLFFAKGLESKQDDPYNKIGQLQCKLTTDRAAAESELKSLYKNYKKDVNVKTAICRALWEGGSTEYQILFNKLKQQNDKDAVVYLLSGDIYEKETDFGLACSQYEQAIYFDPNYEIAYLKYARLYSRTNAQTALEMLTKLLTVNPKSVLAKRDIAELYFGLNQFSEAAKYYQDYLAEEMNFSSKEIERYATILFYNKEFEKAGEQVNKILEKDPENLVMNRLKMYINSELGSKDLAHAKMFMSKFKATDYIALDHTYYGHTLKMNKFYEDAISAFRFAISMDSTKQGLYRDISDAYASLGKHTTAVTEYETYFKKCEADIKLSDYLLLGQDCYLAANEVVGTPDSAMRNVYLMKADSLFGTVCQRSPSSATGYFWRARVKSSLDPETTQGLARPYYEKSIEILEPANKDTKKLLECYQYLGFYYYVNNDYPKSMTYWDKVIAISPGNELALKAIAGIQDQLKAAAKKK